jgi:hypothetical protein
MPINRLIKNRNLDAEKAAVLNRAFQHALRELGLVDRADALTDIVAEKIVEIGCANSHPEEIAKAAIKRLGLPGQAEVQQATGA